LKLLSDMLNTIVSTLDTFPLCESVQIIETISFSESQYRLKIRATLHGGFALQIYCYANGEHIDYAYQLLHMQEPIVRWDNKEHFPALASAPHHFHAADGSVQASPLTGNLATDLQATLDYLETLLKT